MDNNQPISGGKEEIKELVNHQSTEKIDKETTEPSPGGEGDEPVAVDIPNDEEPSEASDIAFPKEQKNRTIDTVFDFLELFVFTVATVIILTSLIFRHSVVEGGSMDTTLADGDHLIITNLFYTPERGDIVVCEDYSTGLMKPIVKRVIALAGDTVKIDVSGNVYVNSTKLEESYVFVDGFDYHLGEDFLYTVPDGEIFVMGDHRNASTDSRDFGSVKKEAILGKAVLRFFPLSDFGFVN